MTVKIQHGDCVSVMKRIGTGRIDLTVTSPPYDDMRKYKGFVFDFESVAQQLFRITAEGGVLVWVVGDATKDGDETGTSFRQALRFKEIGFRLHDTMIFEKNGTGAAGSNYAYWQTFEYMFVFVKGKLRIFSPLLTGKLTSTGGGRNSEKTTAERNRSKLVRSISRKSNIWKYNVGNATGDDKINHPAKFPEKLAEDHILSWSNPGDTVFDPFLGSGTTGKMAVLNDRHFVGCDLSKEYCELASKRIAQAQTLRGML